MKRAQLTVLLCSLLICIAHANAEMRENNFLAFWDRFKLAVISGDKAAVAKMTKFPLSMPYGVNAVRNGQELLRRYDEVFKGEANAAQCLLRAKPQQVSGKSYEVYCPFKNTPNDWENAPIRYVFEMTKSGWKFAGLDNINE